MTETHSDRLLRLAQELGMLRPRDLTGHGIPHVYLHRLRDEGLLQQVGRGLYTLPNLAPTENYSLAEACKRVPGGVICLLSALRFHEIGTQSPHQVWIAIHPKAHRPRVEYPPLRIVRFSGPALI